MIHCIYDPINGELVADGLCEKYVDLIIEEFKSLPRSDHTISVANFLVIDFFRLAIVEEKISHTDIFFYTANMNDLIKSDKNGQLDYWPEHFGEIRMNVLLKIM